MRILVTNNQLDSIGGSETFTFTIIEELVRIGYQVEYFTFKKGFVSALIEEKLKVYFMSKPSYDLILANHNTTVEEVYKKGFTIQTCHGIFPKLEQPSSKADAYVAISQEVQNHLAEKDFPSILIHNSINLERFHPEKKVNKKLERVLSLCHSVEANRFVKEACEIIGVHFQHAYKYHNRIWEIEKVINQVDLVIGLGRSAYEAMACGRPVIVYDNRRYFESCGDGYVKDKLGFSLRNNCSGRFTLQKFTDESFEEELKKYNPNDGGFFREFAEKELDVKLNIQKYFKYQTLLINNRQKEKKNQKIRFIKRVIGHKFFNRIAFFCKKNKLLKVK
jgi:glycosyltransferase involved in cell wall biosynthesis